MFVVGLMSGVDRLSGEGGTTRAVSTEVGTEFSGEVDCAGIGAVSGVDFAEAVAASGAGYLSFATSYADRNIFSVMLLFSFHLFYIVYRSISCMGSQEEIISC